MKTVICPAPGCSGYRAHYTNQDVPRGPQKIEVPDTWTMEDLAFCSLTCAMLAGAMTTSNSPPMFWRKFLENHDDRGAHFHGEGDPPDLLLEVRPTPDSQNWLVVYRPPGHPDTDRVRNGMTWEMLQQLYVEGPLRGIHKEANR